MLAPAVARPLSGLLGRPLAALLGTPGKLGRENSMRSPRRTAQTASALMVGLALVSAMAVFGASLSESATSSVDQAISADLHRSRPTEAASCSDRVPAAVAAVPGVTAANTVYRDQFEFRSTLATLTGVPPQNLADTVILRMTAGSAAALAQGELLIDSTTADDGSPGGRATRCRSGSPHTGPGHDQDRRDLPGQRADPELPGQLRSTSSPTSGSRIRARSCCAPTAARASRRRSPRRWRPTRTCRCRPGRSSSRPRWRASTSSSGWSTRCWRWRC